MAQNDASHCSGIDGNASSLVSRSIFDAPIKVGGDLSCSLLKFPRRNAVKCGNLNFRPNSIWSNLGDETIKLIEFHLM